MPGSPDDIANEAGVFPAALVRSENETQAGERSDTEQQPTHLDARNPDSWKKPDEVSWGEWFLKPGKPLLARYNALGKTNKEIAQLLDYTEARVCVLLSHPKIKEEADLYRDKLYDQDLTQAMKDLLPESLYAIEDVLKHEPANYKEKLAKTDTAKWVIEKIDGKAAQKLNVESGTLTKFFDLLGKMQNGEELPEVGPSASPPTIDITAPDLPPTEADPATIPDYSRWLDENLPD